MIDRPDSKSRKKVALLFILLCVIIPGCSRGGTQKDASTAQQTRPDVGAHTTTDQQSEKTPTNETDDPPAVAAAKENPQCSEDTVSDVSVDDRVLVLSNGNRYLIGDAYQAMTSSWEGQAIFYCNGGQGHRYFVNSDGDSVPVGGLDE